VLGYAAGQTITAGQNVLTLLPKQSELEVQLYAPAAPPVLSVWDKPY